MLPYTERRLQSEMPSDMYKKAGETKGTIYSRRLDRIGTRPQIEKAIAIADPACNSRRVMNIATRLKNGRFTKIERDFIWTLRMDHQHSHRR